MEGTMATVTPWAANFAPLGWMSCNGQLLSIAEYTALFSLIGTIYGGNGQTTFALPDLQGRVAIGAGQGPGLPDYELGQFGGTETNTITTTQMAAHNHTMTVVAQIQVNGNTQDADSPEGAYPAVTQGGDQIYNDASSGVFAGALNATGQISPTGSNIPVNNIQPYLSMYYIICVEGIFPSRN